MAFNYLLAGVAVVALMAPPALAQDTQQPQLRPTRCRSQRWIGTSPRRLRKAG